MPRRRRPVLLLTALMAVTVPAGGASAACTSRLPVSDRRAASYVCTGVGVGMTLVVPSKKYGDRYRCGATFAFADQLGNKYLSFPGSCFLDYDCLDDVVYETLPPPLDTLVPRVTCVLPSDSEEEPHYKGNKGPVVRDLQGRAIGRMAYAVNKDGIDFALVRIDRSHRLDPSVPMYGGPLRAGGYAVGDEAYVYSPGDYGVTNARSGILLGTGDPIYVVTHGMFEMARGTSVMKPDGTAVGYFNGYMSLEGWIALPLGPALDRAQRQTRLRLRLLTAPLK